MMNHSSWEATDHWVRVVLNGETIADSRRVMLMVESARELHYYFPVADVQMEHLRRSDHVAESDARGVQRFWHVQVGDRTAENAAWTYESHEGRPDFDGYLAFDWKAMDHWYEEEEEVFGHARHPYHRVDMLPSSRHVQVFVDDVKVADTTQPYLLFETNIPTRYYIPQADVEMSLMHASDAHSYCPYKGRASYYDMSVNGETFAGAVWYYPDPLPEAPKLKGTLAFWPEKDERIRLVVDGVEQ